MNPDKSGIPIHACPGGVLVEVVASAGSSVSRVRGIHGNALKVAVRAAPEKGKANDEIVEVVAVFFGVSRKCVTLLSGMTSRQKRLQIAGLELSAARDILRQKLD